MVDRLRDKDIGFLAVHERLGTYIMETSADGIKCGHLQFYHNVAKAAFEYARRVDGLSQARPNQPRRNLTDDQQFMEDEIARMIIEEDRELPRVLRGELAGKLEDVSRLYARIVIGHVSDPNINGLIAQLQTLGIGAPACG